MLVHDEKFEFDNFHFSRYSLLDRCLEVYWIEITFNLLLGMLIIVIFHPRLLLSSVVCAVLILVVLLNVIILKRIYNILLKIDRIKNNSKVVTSKVISEMCFRRIQWSLLVGEFELHSVYFDAEQNKNIIFSYKGHCDRPVHIPQMFQQGESIRDLEKINVLINKDDYNDYFVLFREALNVDTCRKKPHIVAKILYYIFFYGFVLWISFFVK